MKAYIFIYILLFCCSIFADNQCDTITGNSNPAFNASFQLWEDNGDKITSLRSIISVENGILYGNQTIHDDAVVIIDVRGELNKGDDGIKTIGTINRPYSNGNYILPSKKVETTLYFSDSTDLHVYDVSDPANPVKKFTTTFPAIIDDVIWSSADTAYVFDTLDSEFPGFHILSLTANTAPKICTSFTKLNICNTHSMNSTTYFATSNKKVYSWKLPLTQKFSENQFTLPITNVLNHFVYGNYSFISSGNHTIVYRHIDNLNNFTPIDTLDGRGSDILHYKGLLCIGGGGYATRIYDISNPEDIILKALFTESTNGFGIDSTSNYFYSLVAGHTNWLDVIDLTSYLPTLDTTVKRDTTHRISKEIVTKKDTLVQIDSIVTTLKKEITTDSLFIKIDSLINNAMYSTTFDSTALISEVTLDSTVDTLGNSSILVPNASYQLSGYTDRGKTLSFTLPDQIKNTVGEIAVFDLQGKLIDRQKIVVLNHKTISYSTAKIASGVYIAKLSIADFKRSKKFTLRK